MLSFLFPSQKHNGVGLGVFVCSAGVALPGQSTIRCFGRLGAGEGTKLPILMTKTPWILHTLCFCLKSELFQKVFELIEAPNRGYPENKNAS